MSIDPFTFEIIRHKLIRVVDEAVITLKHISGSSHTTEAHDLFVGLYLPDGSLLMAVMGYLHALTGAGQTCRHILQEYAENPGVDDGDVFLLNDPYSGAMHTSDFYAASPIFHEGRLVAWSANFVHLRDIGAINPGGFCPDSREIFHEGILCPGIKVVEKGVIRKDVWKTLLNMVRTPEIVALDLHSQLAANITVKERLLELFGKFGLETVNEVGQSLIQESERLLRGRLQELPDGTWRARHYIEAEGAIYTVNLAMTKADDALHFDLTGTSPQAPVAFNSVYWGTYGAILAPLLPILGYDLLWNAGALKPITMYAPEGSLVNCTRPAPNCLATITGISLVNSVALETISKMLVASEKYRKEATSVWQGAQCPTTVTGYKDSSYVVGLLTEDMGGCGGARTFKDGVDFAGTMVNPWNRTPNVEFEELHLPVLYLFHRLLKDSAGAGRFRGGLTTEFAITAHDADDDRIQVILFGTGTEFTRCLGFSGGYPGCNTGFTLYREKDVYESLRKDGFPEAVETMGGLQQPVVWGTYELKNKEMLHGWFGGAGGYGDPLLRDPELVRADVADGKVSEEWARRIYGVILTQDLEVDTEKTDRQRRASIEKRLNGPLAQPEAPPDSSTCRERSSFAINENLKAVQVGNEVQVHCAHCGSVFSSQVALWKDDCRLIQSPLNETGPRRAQSKIFELRQYVCPRCGILLDIEVALPEDLPLYDEVRVTA